MKPGPGALLLVPILGACARPPEPYPDTCTSELRLDGKAEVVRREIRTFDQAGRRATQLIDHDGDGRHVDRLTYAYDERGRLALLHEEHLHDGGAEQRTRYLYDEHDRQVAREVEVEGKWQPTSLVAPAPAWVQPRRPEVEDTDVDGDGVVDVRTWVKYDARGNLVSSEVRDLQSHESWLWTYTYDCWEER